jgi:PTH1 family peptidyl-tRNA hydrolase
LAVRVVVGLGNPGRRYERTRHNVGFRAIDRLRRDLEAGPEEGESAYRVSWADLAGDRVALLKPLLYMNRSGEALARFPDSEVAGPGGHLIILDDVWLPFGALRFRQRGGSGGHLGLESVLSRLGTEEVPRLRLGVGGGEEEFDVADHVLDPFTEDEESAMEAWLVRAGEGVRMFLTEGPEAAMNRFNR